MLPAPAALGDVISPKALGGLVEFKVELALEATDDPGAGVWDAALWDTDVWSGLIPTWIDVTSRAIAVTTNRGRDRFDQRFRTGQVVADLDNQDGVFNPDTDAALGDLRLRPGRWIRVQGRVANGTFVPLFTGQIDTMADRYSPVAASIVGRFQGLDFFAPWQIDDPPALESPVGAGESTDDRVNRVLDAAGWPDETFWRDIQTGVHTMQSTTLAQSRLEELQIAAEAEGGAFFVAANGVPTFKARDWLDTDPRSVNVQIEIGAVPDEVQILAARTDWSLQRVYGDVRMARKGGTEQRVTDPTSLSLYGDRTFQRFDLECETDLQVQAIADRFLNSHRFDRLRLESIDVVPTTAEAAQALLVTEVGDLVEVTVRTLPGAGTPPLEAGWSYTLRAWVQRIVHAIDAEDWIVSLTLENQDRSDPFGRRAFSDGFDAGYS